uniref:Carn_acyltransf domain-containing protein n=1 Tax=Ganoderma boninense TaxID=34458 RepID=A0A5K1JVH2_9APHY|nr:Carn_acyltransf domain-containing protein [Ganoderma boninense]
MPPKTRTIQQTLIDDYHPDIRIEDEVLESKITQEMLDGLLSGLSAPPLLSSAFGVRGQPALAAIAFATGDQVIKENVKTTFAISVFDEKRAAATTIACVQQAWAAQAVVRYEGMEERVQNAARVNTRDKGDVLLSALARLERGEQRLALDQPTSTLHEFTTVSSRNQTTRVRAERFQNRFMRDESRTQRITVHDPQMGIDFVVNAQLQSIIGRNVALKAGSSFEGRVIKSISTEGADGPTNAQRQRSDAVLQVLEGKSDLLQNPFLKYIFEPSSEPTWPETFPNVDTIPDIVTTRPLNRSQQRAVEHMLLNTNETRMTIIQGPPGTGLIISYPSLLDASLTTMFMFGCH